MIISISWDQVTDTYRTTSTTNRISKIHTGMKRCILNLDGTINYYLNPYDTTKKLDYSPANLDGSDGYVMVEIPKFSFKYSKVGSTYTWDIIEGISPGFTVHPAFIKDGVEVDYRYIGAYDACFWDASDGQYKSGLNLDDSTLLFNTSEDRLASVSGIYPLVGMTRNDSRLLANNNGPGWRQQDFWLSSAIQLLYLIEYGSFDSQSKLGSGNTNSVYPNSSENQNYSPHTISGASNSWGNKSTDGTQPSSMANHNDSGTAYMSYRGIENFFGNCWNFVDGLNILCDYQAWATNDSKYFIDDVSTGMTFLGEVCNNIGWATDIVDYGGAFLPISVGGSSSTYLNEYYNILPGNCVASLGGSANTNKESGMFYWGTSINSKFKRRSFGARISF